MEESYQCECGCELFWFFGCFVRCSKCFNEYKHTGPKGRREYWLRRFNHAEHEYSNWVHIDDISLKESE